MDPSTDTDTDSGGGGWLSTPCGVLLLCENILYAVTSLVALLFSLMSLLHSSTLYNTTTVASSPNATTVANPEVGDVKRRIDDDDIHGMLLPSHMNEMTPPKQQTQQQNFLMSNNATLQNTRMPRVMLALLVCLCLLSLAFFTDPRVA